MADEKPPPSSNNSPLTLSLDDWNDMEYEDTTTKPNNQKLESSSVGTTQTSFGEKSTNKWMGAEQLTSSSKAEAQPKLQSQQLATHGRRTPVSVDFASFLHRYCNISKLFLNHCFCFLLYCCVYTSACETKVLQDYGLQTSTSGKMPRLL